MMNTKYVISDKGIEKHLPIFDVKYCADEGRLMLAELILKAGAGSFNSHTEEKFMAKFKLLRADRTPNKNGAVFLSSMLYAASHRQPEYYRLMTEYRQPNEPAKSNTDRSWKEDIERLSHAGTHSDSIVITQIAIEVLENHTAKDFSRLSKQAQLLSNLIEFDVNVTGQAAELHTYGDSLYRTLRNEAETALSSEQLQEFTSAF